MIDTLSIKARLAGMETRISAWDEEEPREDWWGYQHEYAQAATALTDIVAERDALRAALGWYADRAENCRKFTQEGDNARADLDRDGGKMARQALGGTDGR